MLFYLNLAGLNARKQNLHVFDFKVIILYAVVRYMKIYSDKICIIISLNCFKF